MKTFIGLLFFMILPFVGFTQVADTNAVRVSVQDPEVVPVPDMFKDYSAEDKKVLENIGANSIMKSEEYDRKFQPAVGQPVNSERDPK